MTVSFLGIPVDGDIVRGEKRAQQRPLEDLAPLIQAVLDDEGIACFGWYQYTPYFNDGDPCIFSAGTAWFARAEDLDTDGGFNEHDLTVYGNGHLDNDPPRHDRCKALSSAIDGGTFDDVLLEAFGDHAEITVKRDGIVVEFYEHD